MFEQAFKNIDDVLWKDAGCTSELDYKIGEIFGETICDPACGSAGFLCEAFDYLRDGKNRMDGKKKSHLSPSSHGSHLTTRELAILQTATFFGKEKKSLAYVIAIMNMILHGIEALL